MSDKHNKIRFKFAKTLIDRIFSFIVLIICEYKTFMLLNSTNFQDLSIYRKILAEEFESNNCFYCGKKLQKGVHVDHVIPWSYMKEDYLWNFVLACPACNIKKKDKLPNEPILSQVVVRNEELKQSDNPIIQKDFSAYTSKTMWMIWEYAKLSGIKIMET